MTKCTHCDATVLSPVDDAPDTVEMLVDAIDAKNARIAQLEEALGKAVLSERLAVWTKEETKILHDYYAELEQPAAPLPAQQQPVIEDARHEVANWMIGKGYVTGHGDTLDDLMQELVTQAQQAVLGGSSQ